MNRENRWQINKLGLVNFWYYDYEEIPVHNGKLLLRGGNGSGKSVTLQSFIPLLLDGNRAPVRLDPFGTVSRKLDNYMLQKDGDIERTAYLFMEFKKNGIENYITVGMGIKAQKDKPTDVWYFIVKDGKRIGKDIKLKRKEQGLDVILQKKQLKNIMEESGYFFDSQRAYMEAMNEIFFGFDSVEYYEDLLNLIINIRSPKLSKEFKPTKMYEILNDSLKTLSKEDLKSISEAMEEMDIIKNKIEDSKKALNSVMEIDSIFSKYNKALLFNKNKQMVLAKNEMKIYEDRLENFKNEVIEITNCIENLEKEKEILELEKINIGKERELLQKDDNFSKYDEKMKCADELEILEARFLKKSERLLEKQNSLNQKIKKLNGYLEKIGDLEKNSKDLNSELERALEEMGISNLYSFDQLKSKLNDYKKLCSNVKKDIEDYESYKKIIESLEIDLEENDLNIDSTKKEQLRLQNLLVEIEDEFKEKLILWQEKCEVFKISEKEMFVINEILRDYLLDGKIEELKFYIDEIFYKFQRDLKLKLERLNIANSNIKNMERLEKEGIPFYNLNSVLSLDILLVQEKNKDIALKIKNREYGTFIFSKNTVEENLIAIEENKDGYFEIGNLVGKIDKNERIYTLEELQKFEIQLKNEYENCPDFKDLKSGRETSKDLEKQLFLLEKNKESIRVQIENTSLKIKEIDAKIYDKINDTTIEKNIESLNRLSETRENAMDLILELKGFELQRELIKSNIFSLEEEIEFLEIEIEDIHEERKVENKELLIKRETFEILKNICENIDIKSMQEKMESLKNAEKEIPKKIELCYIELGKRYSDKKSLDEKLDIIEKDIITKRDILREVEKNYSDELNLGYVDEKINEGDFIEISVNRAQILLSETISKHGNILSDYKIKSKVLFSESKNSERVDYTFTANRAQEPIFNLKGYLESQIEELELLITEGDRKIFEEILLENLSQKVLAIIYNSQGWIKQINALMNNLETTSSLKLELKWEPKKAESEDELSTNELLKILNGKDRLTEDEKKKFSNHFLTKIRKVINRSQKNEESISYYNIIREVLDFRKWYEFRLFYWKKNEKRKEMTNNNFYQLSGGEKAISMYLPLLAALYVRYEYAALSAPRIVAMDEAFAGVDEKNIEMLFNHLESLDLDYILNSQILWGDYSSVSGLSIAEILRGENDENVALINYKWTGKNMELKTHV